MALITSSFPILALLWAASATQDGRVPVADAAQTARPAQIAVGGAVVASDPPGLTAAPAQAATGRWLHRGDEEARFADALAPDDGVPLPEPAVFRAGAGGDEVVAPRSGDPFFLGFAGGRYDPPAGERLDPQLLQSIAALPADGRPQAITYAFVMFRRRITDARIAELEALGARVIDFQPHYALAVALPAGAADAVAALPFVRWVGAARQAQKLHPRLAREAAAAAPGEALDVYIDVFDSDMNPASTSRSVGTVEVVAPGGMAPAPADPVLLPQVWTSNGWQQRALEQLGVEVVSYVDSIRAFQARVQPGALDALLGLDFVRFVEADVPAEPLHDESTPMIDADMTRAYFDGSVSGAVTAGQIDSGIDHNHAMLNHTYGIGWDFGASGSGSWTDQCGHGSHVNGTLLGFDPQKPSNAGNAPGLGFGNTGFFFNVKFLEPNSVGNCVGNVSHAAMYDAIDDDYVNSAGTSPYPMVVNNSWGSSPATNPFTPWTGCEAAARTLDNEVFGYRQLYVFAAGNGGNSGNGDEKTIGLPAVAKNAFTVGSVVDFNTTVEGDPGNLAFDSSRGPTADFRWKPNICAPGRRIRSALAGTASSLIDKSGTSMAAPHVSGVAAQLMDAYSTLRYRPERLASLMMATAVTKDDQTLSTPSTSNLHHYNTYGAGRINAYKAMFDTQQFDVTNFGFTQTQFGWHYADFNVPVGATRVVVCMTYHEAACAAGASQALVNDLDLWIDRDPIDPAGNAGDYFAQQSTRDNTEIRILDAPPPGAWRWKVYPSSVTSSCYVGLTVTIFHGDTTPDGTLTVSASPSCVRPGDHVTITAQASNPDSLASAVFLVSSSTGDTLNASSTTLGDGAVTDLMTNQHLGRAVLLGDILHGSSRSATWITRWPSEGLQSFSVNARSDNWVDKTTAVTVSVDGTAPPLPQGLISTTHTPSVWTNVRDIAFIWAQSPDNMCGMAGYAQHTTLNAASLPPPVPALPFVTHYEETLPLVSGIYWFSLRPYDLVGNWSASFASFGPIYLDVDQPNYITGLTSSTHATNELSCNDHITMTWDPETDNGPAGMAGYWSVWDHNPDTTPPPVINIPGNPNSVSFVLPSDPLPWYFHLTPVDNAGNPQNHYNAGPYYIDTSPVDVYCVAKVNSQGCTPAIGFSGAPSSAGADNFHLTAANVLNHKNGLVFWSQQSDSLPFQGGTLCVHAPVVRTAAQNSAGNGGAADCSGTFDYHWTQAYSSAHGLGVGSPVYAQYWYRDPASPSGTGLTDAVAFTICQG